MAEARAGEVKPSGDSQDAPGKEEFDRAFAEHAARVRGLCRYVLGSRDAAEDAVSEVFLKARNAQALYDPRQPFAAWIMGVARHHCFDLLRRRRLEARLFTAGEMRVDALPDATELGRAPLARILERESREALRVAVEQLPRRYRLPLVLRYYEELSYDQIGRELSLTRQDVATLLFRAKQKLRAALAAGGATEGV